MMALALMNVYIIARGVKITMYVNVAMIFNFVKAVTSGIVTAHLLVATFVVYVKIVNVLVVIVGQIHQ